MYIYANADDIYGNWGISLSLGRLGGVVSSCYQMEINEIELKNNN
jgi:hypothetical protein